MKVNDIPRIISVKPLEGFRLNLKYDDGVEGNVDLSHLKGKGVFVWWENDDNFSKVFIDSSGAIVWNDGLDIDSLSCYLKITNQTFEEYASR
jgi:Protein of unknown function (DUF2442)